MNIQNPLEGIYACAAKNSAGISKSYGYIKINDSQTQTEETSNLIIGILSPPPTPEPTTTHSKSTKRPPRFLTDVPNLVLINSETAVFDVEVRPVAVSFTWYLDGHLIAEIISTSTSEDVFPIDSANATFFLPKAGQCVAHFKGAKPGRYTCVAKNEAGIAKSTGFIERISDLNSISNIHSNLLRETTLPPISSEGRGGSRERFSGSRTKTTIHTTTVVHRSTSLPKRKASGESSRGDSEFESSLIVRPKMATPEKESVNADRTPIIPNFVVFPPPTICLSKQMQKTLELHVACQAYPPAQINWFINGKGLAEELEKNEYRVLTEHNESRLLVESGGEGGLPKEGIYVAEASNAYGTGRCETLATISDDVLSTIAENFVDDSETVTKIIQKRVERQELFEQDSEEEDEFLNEKDANGDNKFFVSTQTIEEAPMREVEQIHILQQKRPEIVQAPESRIFVPGGLPLVLELKADSESDCTIRWYLKNFELHPNGNTVIVENLERNHEKVTILNPTEGIYKAVIQNDHGMATYECRVLVEVPPQSDQDLPEFMQRSRALLLKSPTPPPIFKPEKQRQTKEESDAVKRIDIAPKIISEFEEVYRIGENMPFELDVKAEARPEAQFQWKHNNFEIKSNDQVQIKHVGENNEKISFAKAVDGIVEVHAVNKLGKDIKRTKVIVDYTFDPSNENNDNKKLTEEMEEKGKEEIEEKSKKLEKKKKQVKEVKENGDLEGVETSEKKSEKISNKAKENNEAKQSLNNDLISIEKQEETYSLLIKVAESVADNLVANIFINALEEATQKLVDSEKNKKKVDKKKIASKEKTEAKKENEGDILIEIDLINNKMSDNLNILANIQMFEVESVNKKVLSLLASKIKEKEKVASKSEKEVEISKETSEAKKIEEPVEGKIQEKIGIGGDISEEERTKSLSQRRPSQQQLDNVNLQDMELLELVNRLRTVEGFLTEQPIEVGKEEKNEEEGRRDKPVEEQIVQEAVSSEKDEFLVNGTGIIKDIHENQNITADTAELEAKRQLEIAQKVKQHRDEIAAKQQQQQQSSRSPSRRRAEIQIVVVEQERTPDRKPEQHPPAQPIPYGGKPKINKITLGVFLNLPPHVVAFNVYLLETNSLNVERNIKMGSKMLQKFEENKLLQKQELLQKSEKQPETDKNEQSLIESEGYFTSSGENKTKGIEEEKNLDSQLLVRLKPEVPLEKSEAEPLSDISERTEDISDEMRDSGKGDKIRRKSRLEPETIATDLSFVQDLEKGESEAQILEKDRSNASGISRKIPAKSSILQKLEEFKEKLTSDLFSLEQLFQAQFSARCGAKLEIVKNPEGANIEVIVADFLLEKVESTEKKQLSTTESYQKPQLLEELPYGPIELLEGVERQVFPKCTFKGFPTPTVTWWIGNEPVLGNKFVDCIVEDDTSYLVAQKVPIEWDGKEIHCELHSSAGKCTSKSGTIRVLGNNEINVDIALEAIEEPQSEGVAEHALKTFYSARYGRKKQQKPTSKLSLGERKMSRESLSTVLERLDERRGHRPTTITRPSSFGGVPPFFIVSLAPSLYLNEGQNITLSAKCVGANRLIWKKDSSIIVGNEDKYIIDTVMSSGTTRLTILNINLRDEASYTCEGINEYGRASTECRMTTESDEMCENEADIFISCKKIDSEAHIEIGVLEAIKETEEITIKGDKRKVKKSVTFEAEEVNLRVDINFEDVDVLDVNLYESFEEVVSELIQVGIKEKEEVKMEEKETKLLSDFTLEVEINYETTDMLEIFLYETIEFVEKVISKGEIVIDDLKQKADAEAKQKAELEAKQKQEKQKLDDAKKKAETEAKQKAEAEAAKQKAAEPEAKKKAELETKQKADAEAKQKAELEAKQKQEKQKLDDAK
uniref:Ig-like domain-containing protein n=1 Tax=Meloidogyne incognita TaxID=6306 RepID=A0A914MZ47_MELIC